MGKPLFCEETVSLSIPYKDQWKKTKRIKCPVNNPAFLPAGCPPPGKKTGSQNLIIIAHQRLRSVILK